MEHLTDPVDGHVDDADFAERVQVNQDRLTASLEDYYDYIVCGSGSAGSVVARRLAENPDVTVLLIEAGGTDDVPDVRDPTAWMANLRSERDWNFRAAPNPHLNGRTLPIAMGKVLGGGSSINVMVWARGHKHDWDHCAFESGDMAWSYEAVLRLFRCIEDWHGDPDHAYRGTGGPVFVQPAPNPNPIAPAMIESARNVGIPLYQNPNGRMMEGPGGTAITDVRVRHGRRLSVFRSYVYPLMDQPNLTVLTSALVTRVTFQGTRATGVEILHRGTRRVISATTEIVLSLGAIHTPKVLMQSGVGDATAMRRLGIPLVQHLPGVGQGFQDHIGVGVMWEARQPLLVRNNGAEATFTWKSDAALDTPDLQVYASEGPLASTEMMAQYDPPLAAWTLLAGLVRPKSRGSIRLTGPSPDDPVEIHANHLAHPDDLKAMAASIELCREVGNSLPLRSFSRREIMPGSLKGQDLIAFIRGAATPSFQASATAKMGRDAMSVVDSQLRVYGIYGLRIADGSILPRITTGNTMAPCVIIGERAAEMLRTAHRCHF